MFGAKVALTLFMWTFHAIIVDRLTSFVIFFPVPCSILTWTESWMKRGENVVKRLSG